MPPLFESFLYIKCKNLLNTRIKNKPVRRITAHVLMARLKGIVSRHYSLKLTVYTYTYVYNNDIEFYTVCYPPYRVILINVFRMKFIFGRGKKAKGLYGEYNIYV